MIYFNDIFSNIYLKNIENNFFIVVYSLFLYDKIDRKMINLTIKNMINMKNKKKFIS